MNNDVGAVHVAFAIERLSIMISGVCDVPVIERPGAICLLVPLPTG